MTVYRCSVCDTEYDEKKEGVQWSQLAKDWACHVCESGKPLFRPMEDKAPGTDSIKTEVGTVSDQPDAFDKTFDEFEFYMADIHTMAETGRSIIEPMRTKRPSFSWDDILIKGAQLAKIPLNFDQAVNAQTILCSL